MKPNVSLVALTVILLLSLVQTVGAQSASTSISSLKSPSQVPLGQNMTVTVTVKYDRGSYTSDILSVMIIDVYTDISNLGIVTAHASSSPDVCMNLPTFTSECNISPASNSGTESVTFQFSLDRVMVWHIMITTAIQMASSPYNVASGSLANQTFTVTVTGKVPVHNERINISNLQYPTSVELGKQVTVNFTVDYSGITMGSDWLLAGVTNPAATKWVAGSVIASSSTSCLTNAGATWAASCDYRLDQTQGSDNLSFSVTLNSAGTYSFSADAGIRTANCSMFSYWCTTAARNTEPFSIVIVAKFLLTVSSELGRVNGGGWYDNGTTAVFSVPSSVPMNGILGTLGGKYDFQGWYENNTLVSSSNNSSLKMNSEHSLTANWTPNYTAPITILGVVVMAVFGFTYYLIRKRLSSPINR